MALSDILADAAIDLVEGSDSYSEDPFDYSQEAHTWIRNAARLLAVAAGPIQDGEPLPVLPTIAADAVSTFVGPQMEHPAWPLGEPMPAQREMFAVG